MLARQLRNAVGLGLFFLAISLGGAERPQQIRKQLEAAFHDGRGIVLVIASSPSTHEPDDETYGDWADNLNKFVTKTGEGLRIVNLTTEAYAQLLTYPRVADRFATLFIRDPQHALIYKGMILEPEVYKLGLAFLRHPSEKGEKVATGNGLAETTVQLKQSLPAKPKAP